MTYGERKQSPDFSGFPDLVVIYLGMRVRTALGIKTLLGLGPKIDKSGSQWPDGLLHFENNIIFSLFPLHIGMRWYWRDIQSLEAYSRSEPHRTWWTNYVKSAGGTGIWHESYHMRGGMEAIFGDLPNPPGFGRFMPMVPARGSMADRHARYNASDLGDLPVRELPNT